MKLIIAFVYTLTTAGVSATFTLRALRYRTVDL